MDTRGKICLIYHDASGATMMLNMTDKEICQIEDTDRGYVGMPEDVMGIALLDPEMDDRGYVLRPVGYVKCAGILDGQEITDAQALELRNRLDEFPAISWQAVNRLMSDPETFIGLGNHLTEIVSQIPDE